MRPYLVAAFCCGALIVSANASTHSGLDFDCMIEARQDIDVRSSVDGIIESILVERGSYIRRGQLIATLASGPQRAALELAKSRAAMQGDLKAAEARLELARKKLDRAEELVKGNFVSANARDEANAEYALAREQVRAARENQQLSALEAKRAEEVLAQHSVDSPVSGLVVDVILRPGELATSNQNQPIVRVLEVDPLNVELVLPFAEYGKTKTGKRAKVATEAPLNSTYYAVVEVVDRNVDAASGTFGVRLKLPNPGGRIPAGIKCRASF